MLLLDDAAANVRPTDDIDIAVDVHSHAGCYGVTARLEARGFQPDRNERPPICRWRRGALVVDIMPATANIGGSLFFPQPARGGADSTGMKPAIDPHLTGHEHDLGSLVRAFGSLSMWRTPGGLLAGLLALLFAGGLIGHGFASRQADEALLGMGGLAALVIGSAIGLGYRTSVVLHRGGLVIHRRRSARAIRWTELAELKVELYAQRPRGRQPVARVTLTLDDGGRELLGNAPSVEVDGMIMLIERLSAPSLAARLARELEAGRVAIVGQLHLHERGWVIRNETVPWRDLESLAQADGVVLACFATAGLHEVGPYQELESAQGHLRLAVERAVRDGARPVLAPGLMVDAGDVADDPAPPLAKLAPGRKAWRAARGAPLRRGLLP